MPLPTPIRIEGDAAAAAAGDAYGRDVWCIESLRTGRYARGLSVVAQNAYHRLITRPGELRDAPDFGLGLEDLIGDVTPNPGILAARIKNELEEDPRILQCVALVVASKTADGVGDVLTITIKCETDEGPFDLVVGVEGVTVELLAIEFPEAG